MEEHQARIIAHHTRVLSVVTSLQRLDEHEWRTPVKRGGWTVAEVIAHLIPWDDFVLQKRLPYLFSQHPLPKGPEREGINSRAAERGRCIAQRDIIAEFTNIRTDLLQSIRDIHETDWNRPIFIGETELTVSAYFIGLAEHDRHHLQEIRAVVRLPNR
ncbi:DinB family protein [Geomicrobium sp. JCM 19037]|uniref:DinB family protein n=1 Tax=Geomicrobium sp. JCM 19037 TaxID=1460634 RepID=UPI0005A7BA47|nr:DinB family protein [Geomicrobium sp. JCM 19037]